jgi:hypothetical protein
LQSSCLVRRTSWRESEEGDEFSLNLLEFALVPKSGPKDRDRRKRIRSLLAALDLNFQNLIELATQAADRVGIITKARKRRARRVRAGKKR